MNTIDYLSIVETINELTKIEKHEIVVKLQKILDKNEISKSQLHNRKDDKYTSHYKIDLTEEDLKCIKNLFLDLEVSSLTENGEAGNSTGKFSSLLDKWSNISNQ